MLNRLIISKYLSEDFPWQTLTHHTRICRGWYGIFPFLGTFIFTFEIFTKKLIILASFHHLLNAICVPQNTWPLTGLSCNHIPLHFVPIGLFENQLHIYLLRVWNGTRHENSCKHRPSHHPSRIHTCHRKKYKRLIEFYSVIHKISSYLHRSFPQVSIYVVQRWSWHCFWGRKSSIPFRAYSWKPVHAGIFSEFLLATVFEKRFLSSISSSGILSRIHTWLRLTACIAGALAVGWRATLQHYGW